MQAIATNNHCHISNIERTMIYMSNSIKTFSWNIRQDSNGNRMKYE